MELKDTVVLFSTEIFFDVFTPATTFQGKINPFSEVANSGTSSRRRILEVPPTVVIPTPRVIEAPSGEKHIVAEYNPDFWNGEEIRHKFPILPVTIMGAVGDIGTTLSSTQPDDEVYGYPYFVRREIDEEERSDYLSGYEVYFSKVKSFVRGDILKLGTDYYRLKTDTWIDGAGFSMAQAVKLESPIQVFSVASQTTVYDPVTDSYSPSSVPDITCFVEPLRQDYEFVTPSFTHIEAGDKAISTLKSAVTLKVQDFIGDYRILSIRDKGSWVTCQCRKLS